MSISRTSNVNYFNSEGVSIVTLYIVRTGDICVSCNSTEDYQYKRFVIHWRRSVQHHCYIVYLAIDVSFYDLGYIDTEFDFGDVGGRMIERERVGIDRLKIHSCCYRNTIRGILNGSSQIRGNYRR